MNVRAATEADLERVREMLAADEEYLTGTPSKIEVGDLRSWLSRLELERDTWLYEDGGAVAAFGWADPVDEVGIAIGVVAPGWKGRGLGPELVARSEARLGEAGAARIHQVAFAVDRGAAALLLGRGYREVRRFYEMTIEHETPPPAAALPDGFTVETLDVAEAAAFYEAIDEAFNDHWEHHSRGFDEWWARHSGDPDFDPTMWFLIRDGDEIAAAVRNEPNRNGGGCVAALGVRRPWRGRGFGRALLLHTFGEFFRRGVARVSLGVDSESPTGATKLYESVGMAVELENVVYEKSLP